MRYFFPLLLLSFAAEAKLHVAATTQDLAALASAVGGGEVEAFAIAKGTQDPHQLEAKPSFMVKLRGVDLVVSHGLELESAWLDPVVRGARNPRVALGTDGHLELGPRLDPIEVSRGKATRAEGDVHPLGNPHFHLDPARMGDAAVVLAERLGALEPSRAGQFRKNAEAFRSELLEKAVGWKARLKKAGVTEAVAYHKTFSYFFRFFGIRNTLHLEPKPGIPPTASHLLTVVREMKARGVRLVLIENFFDDSMRAKLEAEVPGVKVARVPAYVGGEPGVVSTSQLLEALVAAVEGAAR